MTTTTNPQTEQYVNGTIDRYVEIVEVNGTAEDVLRTMAEGNSNEIIFEIEETANDENLAGTLTRPDVDDDEHFALFDTEDVRNRIVDKISALHWEESLLDRYYAANPFYPSGIEIPGCGSYYVIITDDTGEFLLGFYDRAQSDDHHLDLYRTFPTFGDLESALAKILDRNPEGTDWAAWAIQRIDDSDEITSGNVR